MRTNRVAALILAICLVSTAVVSAGCSLGSKVPDVTGKNAADAVHDVVGRQTGRLVDNENRIHEKIETLYPSARVDNELPDTDY